MAKADKTGGTKADRLKARVPRGFVDRGPGELAASERMLAAIREVYELYGFEAVETPLVEYTDALGKFLPDQDRPNEGVFSFQDEDEQWLSLRYDLTAPLARYVSENFEALPKPYRSYRSGWVLRNEKPGPGRFRQFMQFDADTVGAASVGADAEICMMAADTLDRLGLSGQYVVKVNNRKVLDGVMDLVGLSEAAEAGRRLVVLRAIDKLDKVGIDGVRDLLGPGRMDPSGDFTKGAGLGEEAIETILAFVGFAAGDARPEAPTELVSTDAMRRYVAGALEPVIYSHAAYIQQLIALFGASERAREGIEELRQIGELIGAAGYNDGRVVIDLSVVRGLEYYTGPVFEAELTFPVTNEDGVPVRFGSIGGGGRYDGLVGRFRAEPVPATGFSIGVSRLLSALRLVGSPIVAGAEPQAPVVVLVMERDRIAEHQTLVAALRAAGIRSEMYVGSAGMKAQMKYADRRKSPCVIIQGSDERERGEVQIKDLIEGAKAAAAIATNAEYKAARPAQVSVPVETMVDAVREVLARHR